MKDTIKNLTKTFIGESQARSRYTFYAKVAKNDLNKSLRFVLLQQRMKKNMPVGYLNQLMS